MKHNKDIYKNHVVLYMRYSSDNQNDNSIAYQKQTLYTYCSKKGYKVVREYVDEAKSATTDNRPNFQAMIQDAQNSPKWSKIIVYDHSRFSRNMADTINYKAMLEAIGITLVSATQDFGTSPEALLLENMLHSINDFYSRNNAKHTFDGISVKAKLGIHCGGVPPLGYDVGADRRLVINEEEAEIVRLIFDMCELGYSYAKIADILNKRGYRNKYNQEFTKNSFSSILRQEKYTGKYIWNRTKTHRTSNGKRHIENSDDEQIIIDGGCPEIISMEQFERVQEMLDGTSDVKKSHSKHHYMLSGLKIIKCAECGSYMVGKYVESHGHGYTNYACPMHKAKKCSMKDIRTECLDNVVADVLADELYRCDDYTVLSAIMNGNREYDKAKKKVKGLNKETTNIMNALAKGCPSEFAVEKLKSLHKEREVLRGTILKHQSNAMTITPENIAVYVKNFKDLLKTSEDPEVRLYLKDRVKSIIVGKENVTFDIA